MAEIGYEKEKELLDRSIELREKAYKAAANGTATPTQMAIVDAYPGLKTGFLAGIFNHSANMKLDAEFWLRDLVEIKQKGTTRAIKISQDTDLQQADRAFRGERVMRPKMTT